MKTALWSSWILVLGLCACGEPTAAPPASKKTDEEPPPMTNRIDVPSAVRRNLGITFAQVESRDVTKTVRVPGHFEVLRHARTAYSSTLAGHLELLVREHQDVKKGTPLFRVRSPQWREMQQSLALTVVSIRRAQARLDALAPRVAAAALHRTRLEEEQQVWKERLQEIENLRAIGGGVASVRTEARAQLAALQSSIAESAESASEIEAERQNTIAELAGLRETSPLLYEEALGEPAPADGRGPANDLGLARAAAVLGVTVAHLRENVGTEARPVPRWRTVEQLEVRATEYCHIETLSALNGAWVERGGLVLETMDGSQLRFRASGLQADLGILRDGLSARVTPPSGAVGEYLRGSVKLGLEADPTTRKIDLLIDLTGCELPSWARNGVSTDVEIDVSGGAGLQLAVPQRSIILDGLERVLFRRDPKDPNKVIRLAADLGPSDGRWVAVESGLMEGDEVVLDGVYELMLASGNNNKQKGGHFHADGTFHAEDH